MTETPLTDFIAELADPATLERYRINPGAVIAEAGLSADLAALLLAGDSGSIRVAAVKELERARLSPAVSQYFGPGGYEPPQTNSYTYNTNTFNTNTYTFNTNTYTTNTHTDTYTYTTYNTNNSQTTTHTNEAILPGRSELEIVLEAIKYFGAAQFAGSGQLTIVGSGMRAITDLTHGAEAQIRAADSVFYCVADPVIERRLHLLNPTAQSMYGLYGNDKPRIDTYNEMVATMLTPLREGKKVCAVFYGHPGVFAWPTHEAIRQARKAGFRADMQPAVSADASLFADLGIDPSQPGCQSLEATDFLINLRTPDVFSHFLLWQAECAGDPGFNFAGYKRHNFEILLERLREFYPADHPIIIYEATALPQGKPRIAESSLDKIKKEDLTGISTLYFPPAKRTMPDRAMMQRLGLLAEHEATSSA